MDSTIDFKNNDDLAFFGKVNASISHELKNILAIISEAAGLLQDLTEMMSRGQKIELEMLKTCSQYIVEEIQRGFTTIKQMNKFSHSVDAPLKSVNIIEVIDLMINLAGFLSFASKIRFDLPQDGASTVSTCPFRLQNLVYHTLVFAFKSVGVDGKIEIAVHQHHAGFIDFEDENLSLDRNWFLMLLDEIAQRFAGKQPELRAMNGLLPSSLDEQVVAAMQTAGFRTLNLSLGTTSKAQQRQFQRPDVLHGYEKLEELLFSFQIKAN